MALVVLSATPWTPAVTRAQDVPLPSVLDRALVARGDAPVRWPRQPLLDRATERVGAPAARARFDTSGAGATVCVVDTGLDLAHHDFRDRDGRTRVRWLLDLTAPPRGVTEPDLEERFGGAVWSAADIDAALAAGDDDRPRDRHGHGTAVAAVAVGDDAEDGPPGPLAGVAPEAAIVAVRALRPGSPGFADADVIAGIEFCWWVAGRGPDPTEARRTVVVLGLGGHDGAHDGSEPLERVVEEVSHAGLLVVAAAGNDGDAPIHAAGWLAGGEAARVGVRLPDPSPGERHVSLAVETPLPGPVSVSVVAPDGTRTPFTSPGESVARDHAGGRIAIDGERGERGDGARVLYAVLAGGGDGGRPLAGGLYSVELRGPGRFDLWLAGADLGSTLLPPALEGPFVAPGAAVTIPATAPSAIAVGASVSREEVVTGGGPVRVTAEPSGLLAFSSRGPAAGGAPKPDLVAPGGVISTVLSGDVDPDDPENLFGGDAARLASRRIGDDRLALGGTSFAAPLVAGALALAVSLEPARGATDRGLLAVTARRMLDAAWSPEAGAGELAVEAFLAERASGPGGAPEAASSELGFTRPAVAPGARDLWLRGTLLDAGGRPADTRALTLVDAGGRATRLPVHGGVVAAPVPAPLGTVGDVVVYRAYVDGEEVGTASVRLHVDRARDQHPPVFAGGGCAVTADGPRTGGWLLPAILALTAAGAARRRCRRPPRRTPRSR